MFWASLQLLACQPTGKGKYLLCSEGAAPKSNTAYVVDCTKGKKTIFCGENDSSSRRCVYARTALDPTGLSVFVLPPVTQTPVSQNSLSMERHGEITSVPLIPGCADCEAIDFSVSKNGWRVLAAMFSIGDKTSSIWEFSVQDRRWKQLTNWVKQPEWITRPLFDEDEQQIFFLQVKRYERTLSSQLMMLKPADHKLTPSHIADEVAAYAIGPSNAIALWTARGLEIMAKDQNPRLLAPNSVLTLTEVLRPNGLVWDAQNSMIAMATFDRASGFTRLIEIDLQSGQVRTAFRERLGREVSLQLLLQ